MEDTSLIHSLINMELMPKHSKNENRGKEVTKIPWVVFYTNPKRDFSCNWAPSFSIIGLPHLCLYTCIYYMGFVYVHVDVWFMHHDHVELT